MDGPPLPAGLPGECDMNWLAGTTSPHFLMSLLSQILPKPWATAQKPREGVYILSML